MKKTVIAALLVGASVGAHAQSNVQLYGVIDMFVANEKQAAGSALRVDSGGMTTSFWGMRGSEDLGGGLKAIFQLEQFMRNDTGDPGRFPGDPAFARSSLLGLEGSFGKVTVGRNTTPYFVSTILSSAFSDSTVFGPEFLRTYAGRGYLIGDTGWTNSIAYSNNFSGVGINALYTFGDETFGNSSPGRGFGLSANYFGGPLMITGAFQSRNAGTGQGGTAGSKQDSFRLGASYDLKVVKLFGSFQSTSDKDGLVTGGFVNGKHTGVQFGASAPVGPGSLLFSYGTTKSSATGFADARRNVYAIGYDYNLSKRTDVYAAFYSDSGDNAFTNAAWKGKIERLGFGLRHRF